MSSTQQAALAYAGAARRIPGSAGEYGDALIDLDIATFELRGQDLARLARRIAQAANGANFTSAAIASPHLLDLLLDACDAVPPPAHAVMAAAARQEAAL
jgi:hypothetical protein